MALLTSQTATRTEKDVAKVEIVRRIARIAIPVMYVFGGFLVWAAGGTWWPWMCLGSVLWFVATVWVLSISDAAAELRKRKARGEVRK